MKISTTAPHPYNIYYIHTNQKWKISFLGGIHFVNLTIRSEKASWVASRTTIPSLLHATLDAFSDLLFSQTEGKKMSDPRPAAYTNRAAMQERERERERAVKCEDLNDSSTPYKLEIMMKTIKN